MSSHREKFNRQTVESNNLTKNDNDDENGLENQRQQLQRFKVTVSYDGTDFCGWQIQNPGEQKQKNESSSSSSSSSIQGRIEQRLSSIFLGKPFGLAIAGSGRTDSGVHAKGQVFHFDAPKELRIPDKKNKKDKNKTNGDDVGDDKDVSATTTTVTVMKTLEITPERIFQLLSGSGLPPSIQILKVEGPFSPNSFHARESCVKKRYEYTICEGTANPFETRFCYSLGLKQKKESKNFENQTSSTSMLNIEKMREAASFFVGRHDFSAFGVIEDGDPRDPVKNMELIKIERLLSPTTKENGSNNKQLAENDDDDVEEEGNNISSSSSFVRITAQCDRFLWHMMRMVSGTLIEVGLGNLQPEDVKNLLEGKERGAKHQTAKVRVRTAPAQGLCLVKVFY